MKHLLIISLLLAVTGSKAQTATKNYVKETTRRKASAGQPILVGTTNENMVTTTYYDGLGRPVQVVNQNSSPDDNKNIVTHIEYEKNIGQVKQYLPFTSPGYTTSSTGGSFPIITTNYHSNFVGDAQAKTLQFYQDYNGNTSNPYSETRKEASPRQRALEMGFPGIDWSISVYEGYGIGKDERNTIRNTYSLNAANEVKRYTVTTVFADGIYKNSISENGFYPAATLNKTVVKNENWKPGDGSNNTVEEFKDPQGNVVLKRSYDNSVAHDTYYIYNKLNLLAFVLPPMANGSAAAADLDKWGYRYNYDARKRLAEKKLPQKDWEYLIYDKADRVVMSGPVYSPFGDGTKGWLMTKYDNFGRVAYTGFYAGSTFTSAVRNTLAQNNFTTETKSTTNNTIDGIAVRYTNTGFPTSFKLLTVSYYDHYDFPNAPTSFAAVEGQTVKNPVKGQLTGSWTRTLTTAASTAGMLSYSLYDDKYRVIRSYSQNHLGGYMQTDYKMAFIGVPTKTFKMQKQNASAAVLTVTDSIEYDHELRVTKHTQQIGLQAVEAIAKNSYDALGMLIKKDVGGTASKALQNVEYRYNIRGWLTDINDAYLLAPDEKVKLFNMQLQYNKNDYVSGITPLYNGNISSVIWRTRADGITRANGFEYDHLNRLQNAYGMEYEGNWALAFVKNDAYNEKLTYDKNGNILTLKRTGEVVTGQKTEIDDLSYSYTGNQLQSVTDATNSAKGFNDVNKTGNDYAYDTFGNITTDKNKGITAVSYNHQNLPYKVTFGNGGTISYTYDAAGTRLAKKVQPSGGTAVTTDYTNGFQYENNVLKFFPQPEGYVEFKNNQYLYTYQYKDHLSNVRLTYRDGYRNHPTLENAKDGVIQVTEIIEENNYYPFGLKHKGYNELPDYSAVNKYKYAYGGKELNTELGLELYDFGARNYDAAIGRWLNMDPLAENSRRWTPYNYAYNNPIVFVDPDGMQSITYTGQAAQELFGMLKMQLDREDPVYDIEGNHLGNTNEGFTGNIIIYNGNKDKSFFESMTANEFLNHDETVNDVFLLDDIINEISDDALSNIFTSVAKSFEGYNGFNMESIGGKVGYLDGEFNFLSSWTMGSGKGEIVGNRQYPESYESTVENIGLTIINHEWSGHIMKGYGNRYNNHRKAYLEVLKDPMFDKTTLKFQEYNKRRYTEYLELEMEQKKTR